MGSRRGGGEGDMMVFGPVRMAIGGEIRDVMAPKRRGVALAMDNAADLTLIQDLNTQTGSVSVEGSISKVEDFLKLSAALGHRLNRGWELTGQATAVARWESKRPFARRWNGRGGFNSWEPPGAGLNQPPETFQRRFGWIHRPPLSR